MTHTATCSPYTTKKEANRQAKKIIGKAPNPNPEFGDCDDEITFNENLSILLLKEFLTFLGWQKVVIKVEANVDVKELVGYTERREHADIIMNLMWEVMSYWFLYVI